MTAKEAVNWIINIMADIGKAEHRDLWHYEQALSEIKEMLESQPERKIELHGDESAIEILSELRSWFSCFDEKEGLAYHALSLAIREIKANHTERSDRKKGKWIEFPNHMAYKCSECGRIIQTTDGQRNVSKHYPFCHCGADMRGGQE